MSSNQDADILAPSRRETILLVVALIGWSAAMIWMAINGGVQHDYVAYLKQWHLVLAGKNPWSTNNAYGPLHNGLAYLLPFGDLAPKFLIIGCLLASNAVLALELLARRGTTALYVFYLFAIPANFLIIVIGFVYALNDALCASLIVAAILARHHRSFFGAGLFLGLAVLLKYYPALLIPLFALDDGKFRWRLIGAGILTTTLGLILATYMWGWTWLTPFGFGAARAPKILSILAALKAHPSLIGGRTILALLVNTNILMVAAIAIVSVVTAKRLRIHWLEASVLGLLALYTVYKVGHQQFYVPWLFLVAALPLVPGSSKRRLVWISVPFVLFLSVFQWGYTYSADSYMHEFQWIRDNVGFLAFPLALSTLAAYFIRRDPPPVEPV